jgi:hypothetical protein
LVLVGKSVAENEEESFLKKSDFSLSPFSRS